MAMNHLNTKRLIRSLCFTTISAAFACLSCGRQEGFTAEELEIINSADSIMRVLTIEDAADSAVLRAKSADLPLPALTSEEYKRLEQLMVATVTHPSQDGVGIAGPQVGLNRRIVAVQRFDKAGHPFEVYPNIRIVWACDSLSLGPEGCLSVPGRRGEVLRSREIIIEYSDMNAIRDSYQETSGGIPTVRDTIRGFTAVIFQHETDHLDGMLYIDRL